MPADLKKNEMLFTCHKIQPFKVHSSVAFSVFTELCNSYYYLVPRHFHHSEKKPHPGVIIPHALLPLAPDSH